MKQSREINYEQKTIFRHSQYYTYGSSCERVTKEFLEHQVKRFKEEGQPIFGFWDHLTTLPPTMIVIDQEVEKREDGEYQLVVKGEIYEEEDFESLTQTDIIIPTIEKQYILKTLQNLTLSTPSELEIFYDPRNYTSDEIDPIIDSLNELIPTKSGHYIRKAEFPEAILFIIIGAATGFVARFGEKLADKMIEKTSPFIEEFINRFTQLIEKPKVHQSPDVIISIPFPDSEVIVEGAVEEADKNTLEKAWRMLPELYFLAEQTIAKNRQGYFSHLKF